MKKIILSAQNFWFWPTTQMFAIIKNLLKKYEKEERKIDILTNKTTKIFFDNFLKYNKSDKINLVNKINDDYDLYLWIYDPYIIFEGKKSNKKTIFFCNLWFLRSSDIDIDKYIYDCKNLDVDSLIKKYSYNHHNMIFLAYILCDSVYYRQTDWNTKDNRLFKLLSNKINLVGPIIYPKLYKKVRNPDKIIFQLWWQTNPISSKTFYKNYFKVISKILEWLDKAIYQDKIFIIINKDLLNLWKKIFKWRNIIGTIPQEEYQLLLSEARILLHPFGINTFFESTYYKVPNFILPEQHIWHIKSIKQYIPNNKLLKDISFLLYNIKKYKLWRDNEVDFINFLNNEYEKLIRDDLNLPNLHKFIDTPINTAISKKNSINKNIDKLLKEIIEY